MEDYKVIMLIVCPLKSTCLMYFSSTGTFEYMHIVFKQEAMFWTGALKMREWKMQEWKMRE